MYTNIPLTEGKCVAVKTRTVQRCALAIPSTTDRRWLVLQQLDVRPRCDPPCSDANLTRQGREQWSMAVISS
jgi:hypothetical protein